MGECYCHYDGDFEPNQIYKEVERKANRTHKCCECHNEIKEGTKYIYISVLCDGRWSHYKQCPICHRIANDYFPCGHFLGQLRSEMYEHFGVDIRGEWAEEDDNESQKT